MNKLASTTAILAASFMAYAADAKIAPQLSQDYDCVAKTSVQILPRLNTNGGFPGTIFNVNVTAISTRTGQIRTYKVQPGYLDRTTNTVQGGEGVYYTYEAGSSAYDVFQSGAREVILNSVVPREFCGSLCNVAVRMNGDLPSNPLALFNAPETTLCGEPLSDSLEDALSILR